MALSGVLASLRDEVTQWPADYNPRSIIVVRAKNGKGFGFTLKGAFPVCVNVLDPDGAAATAGFLSDDKVGALRWLRWVGFRAY